MNVLISHLSLLKYILFKIYLNIWSMWSDVYGKIGPDDGHVIIWFPKCYNKFCITYISKKIINEEANYILQLIHCAKKIKIL